MDLKRKLNRFLALLLAFAMVIPIISYATTDGDDVTDDTDTTIEDAQDTEDISSEMDVTDEQAEVLFDAVAEKIREDIVVNLTEEEEAIGHKESIKDHTFVCENRKYELYLKEDNCSILIRCKENGAIIESTADENEYNYQASVSSLGDAWEEFFDSGVVIQLIYSLSTQNRFSNTATLTRKLGAKSALLTYQIITDGFICHLNYENYGIEFDLQVKLTDEGVEYYVPGSSIKEMQTVTDSSGEEVQYALNYMYVFPLMAKTMIDAREGYMILPDGNGITIEFVDNQRKYTSPWISRVYGTNNDDIGLDTGAISSTYTEGGRTYDTSNEPEKAVMPVYGMVYTDTEVGVVCSIDEGDYSARLYGNMNGAQNQFWNYVAVQYAYRELIAEKSDSGDNAATTTVMEDNRQITNIRATFIITTGEDADYAGLAVAYREHLLAKGILVAAEDTSYKTLVEFLGADKEDFLVFKRSVVMTTVSQMEEIVNNIVDLGVKDLMVVYDGWQSGGVYNLPVKSYKVAGNIGGESELTSLYNTLSDEGIRLVLNQDALSINPDTQNTTYNTIKKMDKANYTKTVYANVYETFKALFPSVSKTNVISLASDLKNAGIKTIGLSGISDSLFAYVRKSVEYGRQDTMTQYTETLAELDSMGMYTALDAPYSYLWAYTDAYLNTPLGTSGYIYATEEIPFLAIVLKGIIPMYSEYVNFEANATEYYLKMAEMGVYPSFYLTYQAPSELSDTNSDWIYSSEAEAYYDQIVEYSTALKALNDAVEGEVISDHKTEGTVAVTTYSNGVKVYVNYGEGATVDDHYIIRESFIVVDEAGEVIYG